MDANVILIRALKTFVQAFLGALAIGLAGVVSLATGKAVLIGAVSAAISAVMNLFIQPTEPK